MHGVDGYFTPVRSDSYEVVISVHEWALVQISPKLKVETPFMYTIYSLKQMQRYAAAVLRILTLKFFLFILHFSRKIHSSFCSLQAS